MLERKLAFIIGDNITQCLLEFGISITNYAKTIGVTRQTATAYIDGVTMIDCYKLYLTAERFQKPVEWFFEEVHEDILFTNKQKNWIRCEITELIEKSKI